MVVLACKNATCTVTINYWAVVMCVQHIHCYFQIWYLYMLLSLGLRTTFKRSTSDFLHSVKIYVLITAWPVPPLSVMVPQPGALFTDILILSPSPLPAPKLYADNPTSLIWFICYLYLKHYFHRILMCRNITKEPYKRLP